MSDTTHDDDRPERLSPKEVESLREEMRQAETRLAILAARSPAVQRLKVELVAEHDEPGTEGEVCSSGEAAGASDQPGRER